MPTAHQGGCPWLVHLLPPGSPGYNPGPQRPERHGEPGSGIDQQLAFWRASISTSTVETDGASLDHNPRSGQGQRVLVEGGQWSLYISAPSPFRMLCTGLRPAPGTRDSRLEVRWPRRGSRIPNSESRIRDPEFRAPGLSEDLGCCGHAILRLTPAV